MITSSAVLSLIAPWAAGHIAGLVASHGLSAWRVKREDSLAATKLQMLEEARKELEEAKAKRKYS